jgi:flavin-dependent dehydrogenase
MKLKKGDAIEVFWEDAVSRGGWGPVYHEGATVKNVGIFVSQSKKGLCMARGWEPTEPDDEQVLAPAFIPAGMVRSIRRLR